MTSAFSAIVLAGGTAQRMGGTSKADVRLSGRRLLDHALDATAQATGVVVVAPDTVAVPDGVLRTLEDPPSGGPVAGIGAGLAVLDRDDAGPAELVLVVSCDSPGVASAVPRLLAAADGTAARGTVTDGTAARGTAPGGGEAGFTPPDGAHLRDSHGRDQWLTAVYRSGALRRRLSELSSEGQLRGASVRRLVQPLWLVAVAAEADEAVDVDTWADLRRLEEERRS